MVTLKESEQSAKVEAHAGSGDQGDVPERAPGEPGRRRRKRDQKRAEAKNRARKAGTDSRQDSAETTSETKRRQRRRRRDGEAEQPVVADAGDPQGATKAERKRRKKRERGKQRPAEAGLEEYEEEDDGLADENETEEETESEPRGGRRTLSSPVATTVLAGSEQQNDRLFAALRRALNGSQIELISATDPDLVIVFADAAGGCPQTRGKSATVLVGNPAEAESQAPARAAQAEGSLFLPLAPLVRRYGAERMLGNSLLSEAGAVVVAANVRQGLERAGKLSAGTLGPAAPDFTEAIALSKQPAEILKNLSWTGKAPPDALGARYSANVIEQFFDGETGAATKQKSRAPERSARSGKTSGRGGAAEDPFEGLEAASHVLTYWFLKANGGSSSRIASVDELIKARGLTASALLVRARDVILDCIEKSAALPLPASRAKSLKRAARAFELFLLCCRMAAFRRIKFDEAASGPVFAALVGILERIRPAALFRLGSGDAVGEAVTLAGLALPLRKIPFGEILLNDVLESLRLYQLELGISPDGVWQEGFVKHVSVLTGLTTLMDDLRKAEIPSRPFAGAMTSLANFVDAFLTEDGSCPPIAELAPVSYRRARAAARSILKSRTQGPSRGTSLFREEGFFISRSPEQSGRAVSQLVLHARSPMLGGPSLSFSAGTQDLLIGGGTAARKAPPEVRRCTLEEPAAHNAVRVNGLDYPQAVAGDRSGIRIENVWEEKNWAAARMSNAAFAPVRMARTVVHLKPYCAILIVDEIFKDTAVRCEQFWHLAPGLRLQQRAPLLLCFAVPEGGNLSVAFDAQDAVQVASGKDGSQIGWTAAAKREVVPNPYLKRERRGQAIVMGSLFRWSRAPANLAVAVEPLRGGWRATAKGGAAGVRFVYQDSQLKLIA
jgi:Heparinase II/III-like protein